MIRDTVMNSDDFDPLTDLLIGEAGDAANLLI